MLDALLELVTGSRWTYVILFALALGDAVFPLLPSETALIVAGVLAELGRLEVAPAIVAGAVGAVIGDNLSYLIGRRAGRPATERLFRSRRAKERLRWAEDVIARRGGQIIFTGRFVPGGRMAATFTAGLLRYPWATRFLPLTVVAGTIWATAAVVLGYVGGEVVERSPWYVIVVLVAIAAAGAVGFEAYRRLAGR